MKDTNYARVHLKAEDGKITGSLNELSVEGTCKGDELTFSAKRPNGEHFGDFTGTMRGDGLEGTAVWAGDRKVTWTARRPAQAPAAPQTHDFEPKEFHRLFSDAIPPVLHIFPGDTVRTWTVDAGGVDSKGQRLSEGGNPETGPFYIEGALPRDTLVVKFNRIRLNRDSAQSGDRIVPSTLDPGYVGNTKYDYRLSPNEAAIVLGTAMQYNVAEVVDPLVHVVAKIPKKALSSLK